MLKHAILFLAPLLVTAATAAEHVYFSDRELAPVSPDQLNGRNIAGAFRKTAGMRTDISLNGFWKFTLQTEKTATPPAPGADWGYLLVPSFWKTGPQCNWIRVQDGRGIKLFRGKPYNSYQQGWYGREFDTPPEAGKGRRVQLKFDAVFTDTVILLNGQPVPRPPRRSDLYFSSPGFSCDVTGMLKPAGEKNTLFVGTSAAGSSDRARAGIQDNVWLATMPEKNFGRLRVSTLVAAKQLRLDFSDGTLKNGEGSLKITIRDAADGKVVHQAERPFADKLELPYITPKLWSVESPALYYLDCTATGADGSVLDAATIRFGFRELTAGNGRFLLNGVPIALNSESSYQGMWAPIWYSGEIMARKNIRAMKRFGINSVYSQRMLPSCFYEIADEEGFLLLEKLFLTYDEFRVRDARQSLADWQDLAGESVRSGRFDNHPSLVAILVDIFYNGSPSCNNPAYIGLSRNARQHARVRPDGSFEAVDGGDPNLIGDMAKRSEKVNLIADHLHDYFPGLQVLTGGGAHVGDAYGAHIYHSWGAPTAELAALLSRYSRERTIPIYSGEMAEPYHGSFCHLNRWPTRGHPEWAYWVENSARVLGNAAYTEKSITVDFAWNNYNNDFLSGTVSRDPLTGQEYYFLADLFAKVLAQTIDQTMFYWRYDGLAGISPFEYYSGRLLCAAQNNPPNPALDGDLTRPGLKPAWLNGSHMRPLFAPFGQEQILRPNLVSSAFLGGIRALTGKIIGGGADRYERDHAYFGGETLTKSAAVINMTARARQYRVTAEVLNAAGAAVAAQTATLRVEPYSQNLVPFQIPLPTVDMRREFTLRTVFRPESPGDEAQLTDALPIQLFPRVHPTPRRLMVFGGSPDFLAAVQKLGFPVQPVAALDRLPGEGVLVIAPGALDKAATIPDFSRLTERGVNTLVMEQWKHNSLELMTVRSRKAFLNAAEHPVLSGFRDADFSDWRGSHSLIPAYGTPVRGEQWTDWGNRGMVAGNVFRRPQHGNFLPLLVGGFDLYQTPLLEYCGARGSWIGSQLEIGGRLGLDPVATTLFCRMVDYLGSRRPLGGKVGFLGGDAGKKFLDRFGVRYEPFDPRTPGSWNDTRLLIVSDPDWAALRKLAFELSDYVWQGGKILYLHTGKNWSSTWLPFALELQTGKPATKALSTAPADEIWRHGWDQNELYWRDSLPVPAFANYPPAASATAPAILLQVRHGNGRYLFSSLTPEFFGKSTASGKYCKLLSALLTSCGAELNNAGSPYTAERSITVPLQELRWEFAVDPTDKGLAEAWAQGANGSGHWLSGQQTEMGEFVRPGIPYEAFLERDYNGVAWYRVNFDLNREQAAAPRCRLELGGVRTADQTFLNGRRIGGEAKAGRRHYPIPAGLLRPGANQLLIRVEDATDKGGLVDSWVRITNHSKWKFWPLPYPTGADRDYYYNPDWIRQY